MWDKSHCKTRETLMNTGVTENRPLIEKAGRRMPAGFFYNRKGVWGKTFNLFFCGRCREVRSCCSCSRRNFCPLFCF